MKFGTLTHTHRGREEYHLHFLQSLLFFLLNREERGRKIL
jgi:hypothetical protein